MIRSDSATALLVSLLALASPVAAQAPGAVAGVVDVAGPDAQPIVLPGVTLTLTCPATSAGPVQPAVRVAVTDADGAYRIRDVAPGSCSIVAELQRFQSATKTVTIHADRTADVALRLDNGKPLRTSGSSISRRSIAAAHIAASRGQ